MTEEKSAAKAEVEKKKVGKSEIIQDFVDEAHISKKVASEYLSILLKVIVNRLKKGESVRLIPFGAFEIRERKAREGRKPGSDTNEKIQIPARKVPVFKPGKELKDAVK